MMKKVFSSILIVIGIFLVLTVCEQVITNLLIKLYFYQDGHGFISGGTDFKFLYLISFQNKVIIMILGYMLYSKKKKS